MKEKQIEKDLSSIRQLMERSSKFISLSGLFAALFPGYGLLLWAFGFGIMHILYGIIMYYKYDR